MTPQQRQAAKRSRRANRDAHRSSKESKTPPTTPPGGGGDIPRGPVKVTSELLAGLAMSILDKLDSDNDPAQHLLVLALRPLWFIITDKIKVIRDVDRPLRQGAFDLLVNHLRPWAKDYPELQQWKRWIVDLEPATIEQVNALVESLPVPYFEGVPSAYQIEFSELTLRRGGSVTMNCSSEESANHWRHVMRKWPRFKVAVDPLEAAAHDRKRAEIQKNFDEYVAAKKRGESPPPKAPLSNEEAMKKAREDAKHLPDAIYDLVMGLEKQQAKEGRPDGLVLYVKSAQSLLKESNAGKQITHISPDDKKKVVGFVTKARMNLRLEERSGEHWVTVGEAISKAFSGPGVDKEEYTIERLRDLDLSTSPQMVEKTRLIRELMALGRERVLHDWDNKVPAHERESFLHPDVQPKARAICERLHEITKDADPNFFHWLFDCDMLSFPPLDRSELSVVLDGIGDWRD